MLHYDTINLVIRMNLGNRIANLRKEKNGLKVIWQIKSL